MEHSTAIQCDRCGKTARRSRGGFVRHKKTGKSYCRSCHAVRSASRRALDPIGTHLDREYPGHDTDAALYDAMSGPSDPLVGHAPNLGVYPPLGNPLVGGFEFTWAGLKQAFPGTGVVAPVGAGGDIMEDAVMTIAYTQWGESGPLVLFLHGVPTNRRQWYDAQKRVARFCRTISIDMLGMGASSKPVVSNKTEFWLWKNDAHYVERLMRGLYPGERYYFVADDWGGGIAVAHASMFPESLLGLALLDPIAFDGYPVSEIQAIGRASELPTEQLPAAFGAFDQTLVQIYKTMVHAPHRVYNQYSLRDIVYPYVDTDYERNDSGGAGGDAEAMTRVATSATLRLNFKAIKVLADRASTLAPAQLMPYHAAKNRLGVRYAAITAPTLVMWGAYDNMMPAQQAFRFKYALSRSVVDVEMVPDAGHFAATDNPDHVAGTLLNWMERTGGKGSLAAPFLGFKGIWKGDEQRLADGLAALYVQ